MAHVSNNLIDPSKQQAGYEYGKESEVLKVGLELPWTWIYVRKKLVVVIRR